MFLKLNSNGKVKMIANVFALITCVAGTLRQVYDICDMFLKMTTSVYVNVEKPSYFELPSISLCADTYLGLNFDKLRLHSGFSQNITQLITQIDKLHPPKSEQEWITGISMIAKIQQLVRTNFT